LIRTVKHMQTACRALKCAGRSIGLVPTMGAIHEGHLSLIRASCKENDITIVSIFVNPIQFGPAEDFETYPRPIKRDIELCKKASVDFVFHPSAAGMYPEGFKTYVEVMELGNVLCGAFRQGHFRGVATVVAKLFNICMPDRAYFGRKDAQQAIIIQRMAKDLDFPLTIRIMPTVREKNGLALSSRNAYLSPLQRNDAQVISQSLKMARDLVRDGVREPKQVISQMEDMIKRKKPSKIDYISVVCLKHLKPVKVINGPCLIAVAVRFGNTRLIDNIVVRP